MDNEQRKILALEPIVWTGDLLDDCTARWAGLMLRAEWMDDDWWWWAVYDMERDEITIEDSNEYDELFIGGDEARKKAESVAKRYIANNGQQAIARYLIKDAFKITGRGLVFAGYITEGLVSVGDTIEFTVFDQVIQRKITGVEGMRRLEHKINTGLLIKCENEAEIDQLRNLKFKNEVALIFRSDVT